jgi:hypothetical protein
MMIVGTMTFNSSLEALWFLPAGITGVIATVGQVAQTFFPYYLAKRATDQAIAKESVHIENASGPVYNNCTFHAPVVQGDNATIQINENPPLSSTATPPLSGAIWSQKRILRWGCVAVLLTFYIYANYELAMLAQELQRESCWSLWKPDVSYQELKNLMFEECKKQHPYKNNQQLEYLLQESFFKELENLELYEQIVYAIESILIPEQLIMKRFRDAVVGFCDHEQEVTATIDMIFSYLTIKKLFIIDNNLAAQCNGRRERLQTFTVKMSYKKEQL